MTVKTKFKKKTVAAVPKDRLLPKFTTFFFDRSLITAILWIVLTVFGALSYTTFLKREGFPSINIPVAIVSGSYFVNDPAKVDTEAAKLVSDIALKQNNISSVSSQSAGNFFTVQVQYKEGTDAKTAAKELEQKVKDSGTLPSSAALQFSVPYFGATGGDIEQVDEAVSFYSTDKSVSLSDTVAKAEAAASWLRDKNLSLVQSISVKNPFEKATDPATGQEVTVQKSFDRFAIRENEQTDFHESIIIAIAKKNGSDVIKLDDQVRSALNELKQQPDFKGYTADVSASFAPSIKDNIGELQRVLLEGLIAVLVIGSIVIAIRASFITVIAMVTVLLVTLGLLYVLGYSLNVITLFALILGLALIVDDTIIMTEAIDAARTRQKDPRVAVKEATRKISRAMVAATLTASLCFAPLLFVGGILGSFIRAIPITIISSLLISLFVALIFIPFFARFLLLRPKQMGKKAEKEVAAAFESRLAAFIAGPMLWARNSKRRLFGVGLAAVFIGTAFLMAGIFVAKDVVFNIFPPTKDTNGLILSVQYQPNSTIGQAEEITAKVDAIAVRELGSNFVQSSYYGSGNDQSAMEQIELISYGKRDITSQQLSKQLQAALNKEITEAQVSVGQSDVGPPTNALIIQLDASNREAAFKAAGDLTAFLEKTELKRLNGKVAHFTNVSASSPNQYLRTGDKSIVTVSSGFDGDDTTTLLTLAQDAVKKEFDGNKLKQYGLNADALHFDLGQESENQDSFKTLALAFPVLLLVIFFLLALEFKSFLQPLLIFMAIPFSIFGVMLGLRLTNNAISFFTMLGFFALIGLSIKNTILLTDFANQSRRAGLAPIDAAVAALEERFRPLFATSVTAVVSLIPLAISSPFWQGLAVVLIFGLLSSTLLVVTVFPYYYLGAEYLRIKIRARDFFLWLVPTLIFAIAAGALFGPLYGVLVVPASLAVILMRRYFGRRTAR
jgi:multidrug efflux pump subunit AcrB